MKYLRRAVLMAGLSCLMAGSTIAQSAPAAPSLRLLSAVRSAVTTARALPDSNDDSRSFTLRSLGKILAQLGQVDEAIKTLEAAKYSQADESEELRRLGVRFWALQPGKIEVAKRIAASIKNPRCRADAQMTLARAYLRAGEFEAARRELYAASAPLNALEMPVRLDALSYCAFLITRAADRPAAQRLFEAAQKIVREQQITDKSGLVFYLAKAGFMDEARAEAGDKPERLRTLRDFLAQKGDVDSVLAMLPPEGPTRLEGIAIIAASLPYDAPNRAEILRRVSDEMLKELRNTPDAVNRPSNGQPDPRQFSQRVLYFVLVALVRYSSGDQQGAAEIMAEARRLPGFGAFHEMYYDYAFIAPYPRNFFAPGPGKTLADALTPTARRDLLGRIEANAGKSSLLGNPTQVFLDLVRGYKKEGDHTRAGRLLRAVVSEELSRLEKRDPKAPPSSSLSKIVRLQEEMGDAAGAARTVDALRNLAAKRKWPASSLATCLAEAGQYQEALRLAPQILREEKLDMSLRGWNNLDDVLKSVARGRGADAVINWAASQKEQTLRMRAIYACLNAQPAPPREEGEFNLGLHSLGWSRDSGSIPRPDSAEY